MDGRGMYTKELCRWVSQLRGQDLQESTLEEVRWKTLDWLGCAVGAAGTPAARAVRTVPELLGGKAQCTVLGRETLGSVLEAAFVNSAEGHIFECDDVDKVSISHPGAVAVPAALAMAELLDADFEAYALGVVAGYEVLIRIGAALNPSLYDHWHTTGVCGAFAACAAAGKLLEASGEELERGFALAAMMASGLVFAFGTDAKLVNVGHAAAAGILAALLARAGLSAPQNVLEDPRGYGAAVSTSADYGWLAVKPGDPLMIHETYYKFHASCGHTHTALDAFFRIRRQHHLDWREIETITVRAYRKAVELVGGFRAETAAKAKFSLPYCLAAGAIYGNASLEVFEDEARADPRIAELARRITAVEEERFTAWYPAKRAEEVRVLCRDGRMFSQTVELPEGKRPDPALIREKFMQLCRRAADGPRAEAVCARILHAERRADVRTIMSQIRGELYFGKQHD